MTQRLYFAALVPVGLAALWTSSALGGAPTPFDKWSVSNGNIAATCATGLACADISTGAGFLQRSIKDASNSSYLQTIITSPKASGLPVTGLGFSDESFVKLGQSATAPLSQNGIADKQIMHSSLTNGAATQGFDSRTTIYSGWAQEVGKPIIDINQTLTEHHPTDGDFKATFSYIATSSGTSLDVTQDIQSLGQSPGDDFDSVFHYVAKGDGNGTQTGSRLALSQSVGITAKTSTLEFGQDKSIQIPTVSAFSPDERQMFVIRRSDGVLASGSDVLWIFHWQSTGLDARQTEPLRGQWFGCLTINTNDSSDCRSSDKHNTFALPSLPFDPLPFNGPSRIYSRDNDGSLYPSVSGKDKGGIVMASPGLQTGGNVLTSTGTIPHAISKPPAPPLNGAPPVAANNWAVSGGTISTSCPTGYQCKTLVADNGFLQMEIYDKNTGATFFRTITTDKGASGTPNNLTFATDTVVRQFNSAEQPLNSGISAITIIRNNAQSMANVTRLDLGWARTASQSDMQISQSSTAGEFKYLANFNQLGERSGLRIDIDQLNSDLTEKADTSFVYAAVGGDMLTSGGSAPLPGRATTTWKAGDYVGVAFMSQKNTFRGGNDPDKDSGNLALDLNQNWGGAATSFISYDNFSDSQPRTGLISPKRSVGFLWVDNPFGPLNFSRDLSR